MTTGVNRDTLLTVGWLDLSKGPQVLHVPDMAGRYYSVQFTDPSDGTDFAYVGTRTTGTQAGDYLITGPGLAGNSAERHDADILAEQLRCSLSAACLCTVTAISQPLTALQSRYSLHR